MPPILGYCNGGFCNHPPRSCMPQPYPLPSLQSSHICFRSLLVFSRWTLKCYYIFIVYSWSKILFPAILKVEKPFLLLTLALEEKYFYYIYLYHKLRYPVQLLKTSVFLELYFWSKALVLQRRKPVKVDQRHGLISR